MPKNTHGSGPAFPRSGVIDPNEPQSHKWSGQTWLDQGATGMSLRDYFAAQALAGMMAAAMPDDLLRGTPPGHWAADAYEMADAMLAAREVSPAPRKQTSDAMSTMAASYLNITGAELATLLDLPLDERPETLAHDIRSLAASVLGQDETQGSREEQAEEAR